MSGSIDQFKSAIAAEGLTPSIEIIENCVNSRFRNKGQPSDVSGTNVIPEAS